MKKQISMSRAGNTASPLRIWNLGSHATINTKEITGSSLEGKVKMENIGLHHLFLSQALATFSQAP